MSYLTIASPVAARPSFPLLRAVRSYLSKRRRKRIDRLAFDRLLHLDERLLKDIGVTRDDVHWASNQPMDVNAAEQLRRIAKRRGTNW